MADFNIDALFNLIISKSSSDKTQAIHNFIKKLSQIKIDINKHMSFTHSGISASIFSLNNFVFDKYELLSRAKEISNDGNEVKKGVDEVFKSNNAEIREESIKIEIQSIADVKETDQTVSGFRLGFDSDDEDGDD